MTTHLRLCRHDSGLIVLVYRHRALVFRESDLFFPGIKALDIPLTKKVKSGKDRALDRDSHGLYN